MKNHLLLLAIGFLAIACENEENNPGPYKSNLIPVKMEDVDGYRELTYDANGRVTRLSIVTKFVDGAEMKTVQTLTYDASGRLAESNDDTGRRMVYIFDEMDRVSKTEEYVNGSSAQQHAYTYNEKGLVRESITYQNIAEGGGLIPISKDVYTYDADGNVTLQLLYNYTSSGVEAKILTSFIFSDYDRKKNTDEYFDIHPFNPLLKLKRNNAGKLIVQNAYGAITSVETYEYKYNMEGFATQKTTYVTMHNGNSGSYTTTYSFK